MLFTLNQKEQNRMAEHWVDMKAYAINADDLTKDMQANDASDNGVRVYKQSPGTVALQLRSVGSITNHGKARKVIISAHLSKTQIDKVVAALQEEKARL